MGRLGGVAVAAVLAFGALAGPAGAAVFVVDTDADTNLTACTGADDDCTLRGAINASNATVGTDDVINFDVGAGVQTISLTSTLPAITDPVTIDGYSEPGASENTQANFTSAFSDDGLGSSAVLQIEIDRNDFGGLVISGGGTTVRGLAIFDSAALAGFPGPPPSITLQTAGDNRIHGNFIGLRADGAAPNTTTEQHNLAPGISVLSGDGNAIGSPLPEDRNVVSGNLSNFGTGIHVEGGADTTIQGNLIGTNPAGTAVLTDTAPDPDVPLGNGNRGGIDVNGFVGGPISNLLIGGTEPGAGNLISGNIHDGNSGAVDINGDWETPEVRVLGNRIGTNVAGTAAVTNNAGGGIYASAPAQIGDDLGHGNLISGNCCNGVRLDGAGHVVQGNRIGTNAAGTAALANSNGITTRATDMLIGGTTPGAGNLISSNTFDGITGDAFANSDIQGNFIGTNLLGTAALPNGDYGIVVAGGTGNTIGGAAQGSDNLISGNGKAGVLLTHPGEGSSAVDNEVLGNLIGTNAAGTGAIPNAGAGVQAHIAGRNVIGRPSEGNTIAHNTGDGVLISGTDGQFGSDAFENDGNSVRGNSIFSNGQLAIDLGESSDDPFDDGDGVTPNDSIDQDTGNNGLQNFPSLSAVTPGASTTVSGSLNSAPNTTYTIDLYETDACDESGNGEASTHIGSTQVTTDGAGNAAWSHTVSPTVAPGSLVTATATDPDGSTSELSACQASVAAAASPTPQPQVQPQPEPELQPAGTPCRDRRPPITTLRKAGVRQTAGGTRLVLKGTSADHRECPSGVQKVEVSLARVAGLTGVNCRFIKRPNRYQLTGRKNCRRPTLFRATGTSNWTFTFPVELEPGLYRVQARGTDNARNKETPKKRRNIVPFEVK